MTMNQRTTFVKLVSKMKIEELHQGKCQGVDESAVEIVSKLFPKAVIHDYPSNDKAIIYETIYPVKSRRIKHKRKPALKRNHDVVDACDLLIACPHTKKEVLRSGTWATIRYAKKVNKKMIIINPNGDVIE